MSSKKPFAGGSPKLSEPGQEPESPFFDDELFAEIEGETAEGWASELAGYQLESPFQYAFEQEREGFFQPEFDEPGAELYDEEEEVDEYNFDEELFEGELYDEEDEGLEDIDQREFEDQWYDEEFDGEREDEFAQSFAGEEEDLEIENFLYDVNDQEFFYEVYDETLAELLANELDIPETEEYYENIDEPDDDEVVAELDDEVLERLNKLTEEQTAIEEQSPPPIQPTKKPLAVPVGDPVPFAPPPPMGSYWPVRSTHRRGREVAFRATDGTIVGNKSRVFMAGRTSKRKGKTIKRYHVGIDLYAKHGDPVVACEDGVIRSFRRFAGKTRALVVEHGNVVINYGEVAGNSLRRTGLKVDSSVKAGQIIGYVGLLPKGSSMLHFETYRKGTTSNKRWYRHKKPPSEILNPTKYLLFLQQHGLVKEGAMGQPVPWASDTGRSIDLKRAVRLNRHYGQKLGWHDHCESIERFLGFTDMSPSEETLAEAVAEWQRSEGLKPDGIIGPKTWERMQTAMRGSRPSAAIPLPPAIRNLGAGLAPPTDPNAYRRFRLTTYHDPDQREFPTGDVRVPILDDNGQKIAESSPEFFAKLALEGKGLLNDVGLIKVTGKKVAVSHKDYAAYAAVFDYHRRAYAKRDRKRREDGRKPIPTTYSGIVVENDHVVRALAFQVVPAAKLGVGYGSQRGIPYVPFRTLAADIGVKGRHWERLKGQGGLVPPHTQVYIEDYDGLQLPDGTKHDGWFIVNDTGGGIYGAHFDVFVGTRALRQRVNKLNKLPGFSRVWFAGIEQRIPPGITYGLKP